MCREKETLREGVSGRESLRERGETDGETALSESVRDSLRQTQTDRS